MHAPKMSDRQTAAALAGAAFALVALLATPSPARADDRNLLRTAGGDPYVFLLLDTSGSMNWASQCTQDMLDEGKCSFLCEDRDCATPRNADDPASKFRQAKEALYEVLKDVNFVNFGFATFNQDNLRVNDKHWLYRLTSPETDLFTLDGLPWPPPGSEEVVGAWLPTRTSTPPSYFGLDVSNRWGCDRQCPGDQDDGTRDNECGSNIIWDDYEVGCYEDEDAADLDDPWEVQKVLRLPKLGRDFDQTVVYFIDTGATIYKVDVARNAASAGAPSATISMDFTVTECLGDGNEQCSVGPPETRTFTYELVGGFVFWDNRVNRNEAERGWFGHTASQADATCRGWDPSAGPYPDATFTSYYPSQEAPDDASFDDDLVGGCAAADLTCQLRYPTTTPGYHNPPGDQFDWMFWEGDVIPINWNSSNKLKVLNRLAPELNGGNPALGNPEAFAQAHYLEDARAGAETFLRLDDSGARPLIATGATPLAGSLSFFRSWYSGCGDPGNCNGDGWSDIAAVRDPNWECRKKYLIILTDGEESCDSAPGSLDYYRQNSEKFPEGFQATSDACRYVASMQSQEDIQSFVIAFGARQSPKINCLSSKSQPFYVDTKQELVATLLEIFGEIQEQAAAFASAAVPTVQANVADKIYLSSFTPLNQESVWPGRVDTFLKPIPLDAGGLPDRTQACGGTGQAECWLWDAGDSQPAWNGEAGYAPVGLLVQAPIAADVDPDDPSTLKVGNGQDERRVFFGLPNNSGVTGKRQYFRFPADAAEQSEFEFVWNLSTDAADDAANLTYIRSYVTETLVEKQGSIEDPVTGDVSHIQYVLGDIFHADPVILDQPSEFTYYTSDLYRGQDLCGVSSANRNPPVSYAWFADRHACRRKILFVASNDAQLHAFDTGIFEGDDCKYPVAADRDGDGQPDGDGDPISGKFDNGTGREVFSFIPGDMMPTVRDLVDTPDLAQSGLWGVDGTVRIADVFIDPLHSGTPTCGERQWRTVVLGGYREGGPGYYALDVTQPDTIDDATNVPEPDGGDSGYVPSCLDGGGNCGPLPFPAKLWEFQDATDEDASGAADLGESWSRPVVGRVKLCLANCGTGTPDLEDRFVAIFGGGLPDEPTNSISDTVGNWLYMVDVETGGILYKRGGVLRAGQSDSIVGAVPGDITTVDFNNDGYIDTIYFGTTAGFLYKVALGDGPFELDVDGRIADPVLGDGTGDDGRYDPFQVFYTGDAETGEVRPIYHEPTAVYIPKFRAVALAFGTGNRWNLWEFGGQEGRFYMIADLGWADSDRNGVVDTGCGGCAAVLDESVYQRVNPDDAFDPLNPPPDYLLDVGDATPGWYIALEANEKVITEAFSLSGITVFTAYDPRQTEEDGLCALGGDSKIFVVGTANAIGYSRAAGSTERTRYSTAPTFTTQPFVELSSTQNPIDGGSGGGTPPTRICGTAELAQVEQELRQLFPPSCRFAFYAQDIETVRSDTGLICIAPVPVCIEPHNWKEF